MTVRWHVLCARNIRSCTTTLPDLVKFHQWYEEARNVPKQLSIYADVENICVSHIIYKIRLLSSTDYTLNGAG